MERGIYIKKQKISNNMNLSKVTLVFLLFFIAIISIISVSAEVQTLGTFKQNACVNLVQTCNNCTTVNLTRVQAPDSSINIIGNYMQKQGSIYNYSYCSTSQIGTYIVTTCGDADGTNACVNYDFEVTPSGTTGGVTGTFGFYIIVLIIIISLLILGFTIKDGWFVVIGGMCLIAFGIYSINSGIAGYRDMFIPWMVGLFEIGVGLYLSVNAALEMQDIELT
jgi:hypothetical protein